MTETNPREPRTDAVTPPDEDELAELMDPATWDWENALAGIPAPNPTLTVGVRLDANDARTLGAAARAANMPLSRYIREAALKAARTELATARS